MVRLLANWRSKYVSFAMSELTRQKDFCARNPAIRFAKRLLEGMLILAMGVLVLNVLWGVLSRMLASAGVLHSQSSWTEELARFLLVWVGLLGGSLAFATKSHLGLDFFVELLHPAGRRIIRIATLVVVLCFAVGVLVIGGWELVSRTLALGQTAPALGVPKGWIYICVPLSGFFVVIFTLGQLVDAILSPESVVCAHDETEAAS